MLEEREQPAYYTVPTFTAEQKGQIAQVVPFLKFRLTTYPQHDIYNANPTLLNPRKNKLLRGFVKTAAKEHGRPPGEVEGMLDQLWVESGVPRELFGRDTEITVATGCIHGYTPTLNWMTRLRPHNFITTDITGSDEGTVKHQRQFYGFVNPAKPYADDLTIADEFILGLPLDHDGSKTVRDGFSEFLETWMDFEELTGEARDVRRAAWTDEAIVKKVRDWAGAKHRNHGRMIGEEWSAVARRNILQCIQRDTELYIDRVLAPLQAQGTDVYVYKGNYDDRQTLKAFAGDGVPISFDAGSALDKAGIAYVVDDIVGYHSRKRFRSYVVFAPFFALKDFDDERIRQAIAGERQNIAAARDQGAIVQLFVHANPYWQYQDQSVSNPQTSVSNQQVAERARQLTAELQPDIVYYAHEHNLRKGPSGDTIPDNHHVMARVDRQGAPLVKNGERIGGERQAVVVYTPLRTASVLFVRGQKRLSWRGGSILPPRVLRR